MIITDAAIASVPQPSRGPLRAICAVLGLDALFDRNHDQVGDPGAVISPPDWQQARVAAHRAIAATERGDIAAADVFFTTAFTLDRALKPSQIARFWEMSLSGLEAAERALRSSGRYDDAATLASDVAFRFAGHPARMPSQAAS